MTVVSHSWFYPLITTLLNGGWVLQTSRSFHYWQLRPRWDSAPMAGKSRHSSHEPLCIREEGHLSLWYNNIIIYGGRKEGWWEGKQPRNYGRMLNSTTKNTRDPRACGQQKTIHCTGLPVLAQDMHWCRCKNEHAKCKGTQTLMNALV